MQLLLIGKNGQVGWELNRTLLPLGELVSIDYPDIDLADEKNIRSIVRQIQPQVIINAAGYTAVDKAESEPGLAMAINGTGPGILAEEANHSNAVLIHYSTDFVFDGTKNEPYTEKDTPNPISAYGWSKLAGDQNIQQVDGNFLIFRTSWVYSWRGQGFLQNVLRWARENEIIRIVDDQIGSPTWARMLAEITAQVLAMSLPDIHDWMVEKKGVYNVGGAGATSRYEWAQAILKYDPHSEEQIVKEIKFAKTNEFPAPAERPSYSPLNCRLFTNTFGLDLPQWEHPLKLALGGKH